MSLHWGGEFLTKVLPPNLRDRLEEINTDPDHDFSSDSGFVQCNGETGEAILVMPGVMPRRVSRRKLRTLMSEGLDIEVCREISQFVRSCADSITLVQQELDRPYPRKRRLQLSSSYCIFLRRQHTHLPDCNRLRWLSL
jgi:hypothetical protein